MKSIFVICLIAICVSQVGHAKINHSLEVKKAQEIADSFETPYPIHVFNRDELNFLIVKNKVMGEENRDQRYALIGDYVKEKVGVELDRSDVSNLDSYITDLPNSAVSVPIGNGFGSEDGTYKLCAVFPRVPNSNGQMESERLLGMNIEKDLYHGKGYKELKNKMSYEELYLFSLYHEVGHCVDEEFAPAVNGQPSAHSVHMSEAQAEVMAYLLLKDRLGLDVAQRRSLYRALYSRVMGEHLTTVNSLGTPLIKQGGAIYFLAPYLMEAYQSLSFRELSVEEGDPQSYVEATKKIMEVKMYPSRTLAAIVMMLREGYDSAYDQYKDYARRNPDIFYNTFVRLNEYKIQTDYWLEDAFEASTGPTQDTIQAPSELPLKSLCLQMQNDEQKEFIQTLSDYRQYLRAQEAQEPDDRISFVKNFKELSDLNQLLTKHCTSQLTIRPAVL